MDFNLAMQKFLNFQDVAMDKLISAYTVRITETLDTEISKFSQGEKKEMNNAIMCLMAYFVHMRKFRPGQIINSDFDE